MTLSSRQELLCWLFFGLLAIVLLLLSHTFYVTRITYYQGLAFGSVIAFLFWFKFRKRGIPEPKWLKITADSTLVILCLAFLLYLLGLAS